MTTIGSPVPGVPAPGVPADASAPVSPVTPVISPADFPGDSPASPQELAARIAAELPAGFVWGAATSAYQIEGSTAADGRGTSIWDTFARTPGKVWQGESGDPGTDHYRRYRSDVALMAELGLTAYRFSVAWPRIQPTGRGPANPAGLDFYERLVDELLGAGIDPWITLYHWDLPQALQDRGGWSDRDTAHRFAEYAALVADRLADRVRHWSTLNEPWCSAFVGHLQGRHAPGLRSAATAVRATHHLLLGHGLAVGELRARGARQVGITLNLYPVEISPAVPEVDLPAAQDAARLIDGQQNRLFLDPVLRGEYPADVVADLEQAGAPLPVLPGDLDLIGVGLDYLGMNYYCPLVVAPGPDPDPMPSAFVGADNITLVKPTGRKTALGWAVRPDGLTSLLLRVARDYPGIPLYLHENGAAFDDRVAPSGEVDDADRVDYLATHIDAARAAVTAGVDLRGYFVWSLMDNFEWAEGYRMRFGIVYVDFETQQRTLKSSARWYSQLIRAHRSSAGSQ